MKIKASFDIVNGRFDLKTQATEGILMS